LAETVVALSGFDREQPLASASTTANRRRK